MEYPIGLWTLFPHKLVLTFGSHLSTMFVKLLKQICIYTLQIFLLLLVPVLDLVIFILESTFYDGVKVYQLSW